MHTSAASFRPASLLRAINPLRANGPSPNTFFAAISADYDRHGPWQVKVAPLPERSKVLDVDRRQVWEVLGVRVPEADKAKSVRICLIDFLSTSHFIHDDRVLTCSVCGMGRSSTHQHKPRWVIGIHKQEATPFNSTGRLALPSEHSSDMVANQQLYFEFCPCPLPTLPCLAGHSLGQGKFCSMALTPAAMLGPE